MKRFTATEKWEDPWYRKLSPVHKAFIQYLWDRCDSAGVWIVDMELAATYVGAEIGTEEALQAFNGRVVDIGDGKWLVPQFISFQYGELSEACKPHKPILAAIKKHGLSKNCKGYQKGFPKGIDTLQEKDKEKDKEKEGGTGGQAVLILEAPTPDVDMETLAAEIYELYPLKTKKPRAIAAIKKAMQKFPSQKLRETTERYAKQVLETGYAYVPHPATWFNNECFNDSPSTWTPYLKAGRPSEEIDKEIQILQDELYYPHDRAKHPEKVRRLEELKKRKAELTQ